MRPMTMLFTCSLTIVFWSPVMAEMSVTEPSPGIETLDDGFDLAILNYKNPALVFYDQTRGGLFFTSGGGGNATTWDPVLWNGDEFLSADLAVSPHLSVYQPFQSMVDASVTYYDDGSNSIKFVEGQSPDNGSSWTWSEPLEISSGSITAKSNDLILLNPWYATDTTLVAPYLDSSGMVAYTQGVRSGSGNGTSWFPPVVLPETYGAGEKLCAISVNNTLTSVVGIAYYDTSADGLNYLSGTMSVNGTSGDGNGTSFHGLDWQSPHPIDSATGVGKDFDMVTITEYGWPVIAYYDESNTALKFASLSSLNGTTWYTETVVDTGTDISSISMAMTGLRQVGISYYDAGLKDMMYVTGVSAANGTSWGEETIWSEPVRVSTQYHGTTGRLASRYNNSYQVITSVTQNNERNEIFHIESIDDTFSGVSSRAGDVNADGVMDLKDAIIPLQVVSGTEAGSAISLDGDLTGDGVIGIEESINGINATAR